MSELIGDISQHELIGTHIRVAKANHEGYENMSGSVVDETMKTITIKNEDSDRKKIPKTGKLFKIKRQDYEGLVKGDLLIHRPEDRIKKAG